MESSTGSVQIGFDARLLIEALAHIETDSLAIEFSGKLNPVLIKPVSDDDNYVSLIMPMRLDPASE